MRKQGGVTNGYQNKVDADLNMAKAYAVTALNDSGAGKNISSIKALVDAGVPRAEIERFKQPLESPHIFECGGGDIEAEFTLQVSSPLLGRTNIYLLPYSPFALSMGDIVENGRRPLIWVPARI